MLRCQAEQKQAEYGQLQHQQKRIAFELAKIKKYIEHLNGLLEVEGLPTISLRDSTSTSTSVIGRPGNRSKDMPLRRPEWDGFSLPEAISDILDESDEDYHADILVERIYEIQTPAEHKRAKQSLVSTLRQGDRNGKWLARGGNKYRGIKKQRSLQLD
jgi:hypothetical protein